MPEKILKGIDIGWTIVIPFLACCYLVYHDYPYSHYIMLVGWLVFLLHGVASLNTFRAKGNWWISLWSVLNGVGLIVCVILEIIDVEGFLMLELVCETAAYVCAILVFVVTNQKLHGRSIWKTLGPGMAIMNVIILSVIIFPFLAIWFEFIAGKADDTLYWIGLLLLMITAVIKKIGVLREFVHGINPAKRSKSKEEARPGANNEPTKQRKFSESKIFVVFFIFWFATLIILKNL